MQGSPKIYTFSKQSNNRKSSCTVGKKGNYNNNSTYGIMNALLDILTIV